ncbi:rhodanese-like domain-containing protein [Flavivirga eckloniae]|uniref:Rhodanese-like domain-containing protein n=1 Tax=Flavivirga eckloniae TaxID=1803846 RepID=A0A2K9PTT8_9FLAO|nr:rhodanese-like domain-containing protein [Flavivirga eckloniae]AUP80474.1 rhodanese-like domain-containing protein [Flavivirga eckloniae]
MKRLLIFLCSVFSIGTTSCKDSSVKGEIELVSPKVVQTLLAHDSVQLVDVRTPKEFSEGRIAEAQNVDFHSPEFDSEIKKLDQNKPVVLYCRSGKRSAKSGKKLLSFGFTKVYDLEGGILMWKKEGFKVTIE